MEKILSQILEELKGLKEGQGRLAECMDGLDKQMDSLEVRMDGLDKRMDSLEKRQVSMEAKLDAVYDQVVENCEKLTENEMTFDMFQDLWFEHEKKIHRLNTKIG